MTARIVSAAAALGIVLLAVFAPHAAGAGWRWAFVCAGAVPAGAIALILIARLTGAGWADAVQPLAWPAPWLVLALIGFAIDQWLRPVPPHLALWLSPVPFLIRGLAACGLWWWLARRAAGLTPTGAGLALLAHAALIALVAPDWLLGVAPGQPFSAIVLVLAVGQILMGCAAAILSGFGEPRVRQDLARLLLAAALGLGYLVYMDYLIVWYGNLPPRVDYYALRTGTGWGVVPLVALGVGLLIPVLFVAANVALRVAAAGAILGWGLLVAWLVLPGSGAWSIVAAAAAGMLFVALPFTVRRT